MVCMGFFLNDSWILYQKFEIFDLTYKNNDDQYPIKFSSTWQHNFVMCHNFNRHKLGTRMNGKVVTPRMIDTICNYHINLHTLQLLVWNHVSQGVWVISWPSSHKTCWQQRTYNWWQGGAYLSLLLSVVGMCTNSIFDLHHKG